ncbi:MAG: tetratricopeptide repeat protein [Bacteroidota bacterium]|jgi:tetratricopeptide (TPR) repeat protein
MLKVSLRFRMSSAALTVALALAIGPGPATARTGDGQPEASSLLGSYLAGRVARGLHDTAAAADFYERALKRDSDNDALLEQALAMYATEGRWDDAVRLAKQLAAAQPTHRMARLIIGLSEAKAGRYGEAKQNFQASGSGLMGELTSAMARAWMTLAEGNVKGAIDIIDGVKQAEWAQVYLRYHKALISDAGGRRQEARALYERAFRSDSKSLRITMAYAQHAAASGDAKLARTILDEYAKRSTNGPHPVAKDLLERLKAGEKIGLLIDNPIDGLAEVFYGLGEALSGEGGVSVGAVYLQMALYLRPQFPFALAALASLHENTKKYADAIAAYDRIPRGTPLQAAIDIRKALNLNQLERVDEAKELLERVAKQDPADVRPLEALGNIMRGRKRYEEAVDYYSRAIALIGKPEKKHWSQFYARGTCYERIKKWPQAEADLQKAMQLAPDQPLVLNYLGYSWVDQNRNLKQGLALIERAVQLKPDDGYIVDSLGWAHYRLGNVKESVKYLERAVELRPEDPVLNDHLGDALWRVGRRQEARYQWEQALTLKPEPEDAEKIKRKLAKGLPARPQAHTAKRSKEAERSDALKKRSENKLVPRPVLE